ncbi:MULTISPECIES: CDP-diacylglycerol--glycerol-3-phosphate 3-phosphatidyltransferase [unclassified Granulicatella]|uniref:CDP-diacylglycerol--glycerol-3-phosphate 3-phosphatidyltransferase n=1 Tax=unclassified Granulicatella TaxID=2630493 RepID=UPI0010733B1D|nr:MULTISPECIES: CDP-diacylglycerol--glycerol-3-phosphate 3-phosphatidyltransferase [unclassified Granulicatella]MBF0779916.1 CDP-diacylglycerol--glycerol-3-phosphate 3-phosphatidyltransferase [Granulicatella sp. 19428wC4_WM01]TFU96027.1 CDP-diacylglycerol--glycerol-3-phosphate 3-phosphatidyltransferase [Granulicatella sp. WM01]
MNIANKLTLARLCCVPLFMLSVYGFSSYELATLLFILASVTDWLDGYIARKYHLVTTFGKFADPLADKLLVMTALIILVEKLSVPAWIVAIIVCRELAVTGLRLLLVQDSGVVLAADWSGKVKTFTQMIAIVLILMSNFNISFPIGEIFLYLSGILAIYSGIEYFIKNKHVFKNL